MAHRRFRNEETHYPAFSSHFGVCKISSDGSEANITFVFLKVTDYVTGYFLIAISCFPCYT